MTTLMRLIILLSIVLFNLSNKCFSQELKYGDLYNYNDFKLNKNPDEIIKCEEFFKVKEDVNFIDYECLPNIIEVYKSIQKYISYPREAEIYKISGYVYLNVLIDKNGKLYCYEIKTELGELFVKQAEYILKNLQFEKFECRGKSFAYTFIIPVKYIYDKKKRLK